MADLRRVKDLAFRTILVGVSALAFLPIFHLVGAVIYNGIKAFIAQGPSFLWLPPGDPSAGEIGGVGPAISGSVALAILSLLIGFPLSMVAGIFIHEFRESPIARALCMISNLLVETPTVLLSMFVFLVLVVPMGRYSALAGAVALTLVMLPYVVTHVREAMDAVPRDFEEAGYSLGMRRFHVIFKISLRAAKGGIWTALIVAAAKALGETAPLLFTIGGSGNIGYRGVASPTSSLQLLIYKYAFSPFPERQLAAWGAALVLMLIFMAILTVGWLNSRRT